MIVAPFNWFSNCSLASCHCCTYPWLLISSTTDQTQKQSLRETEKKRYRQSDSGGTKSAWDSFIGRKLISLGSFSRVLLTFYQFMSDILTCFERNSIFVSLKTFFDWCPRSMKIPPFVCVCVFSQYTHTTACCLHTWDALHDSSTFLKLTLDVL